MFVVWHYFQPKFCILILEMVLYNNIFCYSDRVRGWNYLNLHCRDNENKPVEWWYIYKPPTDVAPYLELGRNFTYITSGNAGRWQPSDKYITSNSMLQHTLSPIYRPTYVDYLAVAIYEDRKSSDAHGVLMADEVGGVWIGHTVPGLINLDDRHSFPDNERANGHLLMCLSVDLIAINEIASVLYTVAPKFTYVKTPKKMDGLLPRWNFAEPKKPGNLVTKKVNFLTSADSLVVEIIARPPRSGDPLYDNFAASKNLVMDVYSPTSNRHQTSVCNGRYSVRNIETISLKLKDSVLYVSNKTDRSKFAVSTAAPWQELKVLPPQYWTCTSSLDKEEDDDKGGLITCVDDYNIWLTFDNLKIKEPEC
ncbi:plancitoxin-1-like isoform X2 [Battus philenor]|uniref:plancitoxin-1-like isoform X2 n=1 Tax=Battus philenor TaxID=42288 RepID=UPI0035CECDB1